MTVEPADADATQPETSPDRRASGEPAARTPDRAAQRPDAGHLDDDPEALEDPVHRGDAQHQHAVHARPPAPAD
jgi:hypothetical protein